MAVVPSHRIHTLHGTFGGPSFASVPSASAAQANSFVSLPNVSCSRRANLSILQSRAAPSSGPSSLFIPRPRSASIRIPNSTRRAPPPPPRTIVIPAAEEDPFADTVHTEPIVVALPPPRRQIASRTQMPSVAAPTSQSVSSAPIPIRQSSPPVKDMRAAKLVASVLLSRGCGRPMRRRLSYGESRSYVKSSLSQMVEIEC
ncbi:hypothetical protein C8Q75DRAFT_807588 [Abortiporus biennis]|nr:hypothetical protein C8Q75DRAFT_807588 [Abortiporus biennis]